MKEAKVYIAETPGGAYKAYAVGYDDNHKPGSNSRTRYKSIPDQPFRGFSDSEEVRLFLLEKFGDHKAYSKWAEECGKGSLCLKDISQWEEMLLPGAKTKDGVKKTRKKRLATKRLATPTVQPAQEETETEAQQDEPLIKELSNEPSDMGSLGIPIEIKKETAANKFTYEQYKQIADGIVQQFENTLLSCMMYNVSINAVGLVHAYRALKLVNVLQWTAALEAAKMAAQDQTWIKFYESILNANKVVGLPI